MTSILVLLCLLYLVSVGHGTPISSESDRPDSQSAEKSVEIEPPSTVTEPELSSGPAVEKSSSDGKSPSIDASTSPLNTPEWEKSSSGSQFPSIDESTSPLETSALEKSSLDGQSPLIDESTPSLETSALEKSSSDSESSSSPDTPELEKSSLDGQSPSIDESPSLETSTSDKSSSDSKTSSDASSSLPETPELDKSSLDGQSPSIDESKSSLENSVLDKSSSESETSSDASSSLPETPELEKAHKYSQSPSIDESTPSLEISALEKSSSDSESSSPDTPELKKSSSDGQSPSIFASTPSLETSALEKSSLEGESGSLSQPVLELGMSSTETKGPSYISVQTPASKSDSLSPIISSTEAASVYAPTMAGDLSMAGPYPKSDVSYQTSPQVFVLLSSDKPTHLQKVVSIPIESDASSIETSGVPSAVPILTRDFSRAPGLSTVYNGADPITSPYPLVSYLQTNLRNGQQIYSSGTPSPSENRLLPSYTYGGSPVGGDILRYSTPPVPAASYQHQQVVPTRIIASTQGLQDWYQGASYTFPYSGEVRGENSIGYFSSGYSPNLYSQQYYFTK